MNIEQAQCIPMSEILQKISCCPVRETSKDIWFLSPLHTEKTPSFHISKKANCWYDFGIGIGGTPLKFACEYLKANGKSHAVTDALE